MDSEFKIDGLAEISKALDQVGDPKSQQQLIKAALRPSANIFKEKLKQNAPIGDDVIYNDIKVRQNKMNPLVVTVGAGKNTAYKVNWLEFGTVQRTTKSGANRGKMSKEGAFVAKSFFQVENEVMKKFQDEFLKDFDKAIQRKLKSVTKKLNS